MVLALSVGYLVPSGAFAEGQALGSIAPQRQAQRQQSRLSLDDRVGRFAKSLDLSEAQRSAVKKILELQQEQILRIRSDASVSGSVRISRVRALQESTVEQIRAVLNEEQKKKYNPLAPRTIPPAPQTSVEDWIKATAPH
jgi:hypothetical protein